MAVDRNGILAIIVRKFRHYQVAASATDIAGRCFRFEAATAVLLAGAIALNIAFAAAVPAFDLVLHLALHAAPSRFLLVPRRY